MKTIHIFTVTWLLGAADIIMLKINQGTSSAFIWGLLTVSAMAVMVMAAKELRGE